MAVYLIGNFASPLTVAPIKVATSAIIKTLLQVKASATKPMKVIEWGISHDGSAAATPGNIELVETDVAATVTAHVAAGIVKWDAEALAGGDPTTNLILVGTTATGFTATAEGTTLAARLLDPQLIAPTNQYVKQFPLGREPQVQVSKFLRIRVTFPVTVNALCYVLVEV